jgi:hypothetical protein
MVVSLQLGDVMLDVVLGDAADVEHGVMLDDAVDVEHDEVLDDGDRGCAVDVGRMRMNELNGIGDNEVPLDSPILIRLEQGEASRK